MHKDDPVDILKGAMLLEHRGRALYLNVAAQTKSDAARGFFETMAQEEKEHLDLLSDCFVHYMNNGEFPEQSLSGRPKNFTDKVLVQQIVEEITMAGYEAAAISAALNFEEKAVEYYTDCKHKTDNPKAADMYEFLANWEKTHMEFLAEIDNELKLKVWGDNKFWPSI